MRRTSITPWNSGPSPIGRLTQPRRLPKRSSSIAIVVSKSVFSRSMRLTNRARARGSSSAAYQSLTVVGWGPSDASTTNRAVSATESAA